MAIKWESVFDDPSVVKEVESEIEKGYWKESKLDLLTGRGKRRAIRVFPVNNLSPYMPRIKDKLRGDGVVGNTDLEANLDEMEIFSHTIYPKVIGNALKSEIKSYTELKKINFVKESVDSLKEWVKERVQAHTFATLVNNFTNVVCAKATDGAHDTSSKTTIASACNMIGAGDVLSVKTIQKAVAMAKNGRGFDGKATFPINPISVELKSESGISFYHETYVVFVDSFQAEQLKADPEWKEMQKSAGERGKHNAIFTGILGTIEDCAVIEMGSWNDFNVGLPTSGFAQEKFESFVTNASKVSKLASYSGSGSVETCLGVLIGAGGMCLCMNEKPHLYIDDTVDMGRKTQVGIDKIFGVSKAVYGSHNKQTKSPYDGQDFAVIGIVSAKA
ncbi:MAG: phage capsid family protein [Wolinella sp.]